jgi:hypothetical protein
VLHEHAIRIEDADKPQARRRPVGVVRRFLLAYATDCVHRSDRSRSPDAERRIACRQRRTGEREAGRSRRLLRNDASDVDLVVVEVGGVQEIRRAVVADREALVDGAARIGIHDDRVAGRPRVTSLRSCRPAVEDESRRPE